MPSWRKIPYCRMYTPRGLYFSVYHNLSFLLICIFQYLKCSAHFWHTQKPCRVQNDTESVFSCTLNPDFIWDQKLNSMDACFWLEDIKTLLISYFLFENSRIWNMLVITFFFPFVLIIIYYVFLFLVFVYFSETPIKMHLHLHLHLYLDRIIYFLRWFSSCS